MAGVSAPIDVASLGPNESSKEASFIDTMLARGVNLHVRDNNGRNALHLMSLYGSDVTNRHNRFVDVARSNARIIARVAAQCPELLDQTDDWGRTPLSYAASLAERTHDSASVSALVEAGADLEIPDNYGNTVLHRLMPAFIESAEIRSLIESLLKKMLDVNHRNRIGQTPLFEIMRRADARDRIETTGGISGALKSLQEAGVDIAAKDKRGQTLLHLAAANWQTGSHWYPAFLEHGLDPMDEDNEHKTSLDVATACSNEKVLALFTGTDHENGVTTRTNTASEPVGAH
jgi:ankyrin repeat protein